MVSLFTSAAPVLQGTVVNGSSSSPLMALITRTLMPTSSLEILGRGINVIMKMVNATRVDVTNWSASLMRQAVTQAAGYVVQREAFGAPLIDKPLMRNVLADLELETEVATMMTMRLAGAFERAPIDDNESHFLRLSSAVAKYWLSKRSTPVVREALECLGGAGFVEEGPNKTFSKQ